MTHVVSRRSVRLRRAARSIATFTLAAAVSGGLGSPAVAEQSGTKGTNNDISDVTGVLVGNITDTDAHTGATVVLIPDTATAGVDVRGGAAITRETDLLKPTNEVNKVNAILLTGGGEYGLASGPGAMQWLYENYLGFQVGFTPDQVVPILPGAAINDLHPGRNTSVRPTFQTGYDAAKAATVGPVAQGNVGAGAGAVAGGLKGGLGSASIEVAPGIIVAALVVVNSSGTTVDTDSACGLLAARYGVGSEFANTTAPTNGCGEYRAPTPGAGPGQSGSVIGVVATNVNLDKVMNQKIAEVAHDGVTRSLGSAHGMGDGDTFFSISTDKVTPAVGVLPDCIHAAVRNTALGCQLLYQLILNKAPEVVARAIGQAMLRATSVPGLAASYCDTFAGACTDQPPTAAVPGTPTAPLNESVPAPLSSLPPLMPLDGGAGVGSLDSTSGSSLPPLLPVALLLGIASFGVAFAAGARTRPWLPVLGMASRLPRPRLVKLRRLGARHPRARRAGVVATLLAAATLAVPTLSAQSAALTPADPGCEQDSTCLAQVNRIGEAMKRAMARAIAHSMVKAKPVGTTDSYCSTFPTACAGVNGYPQNPGTTGPYNNITDVPGVQLGAYTDDSETMGTTVVFLPDGGTAGVEVRGSAPGGRGTDSMRADTAVQRVNALILTGGSAYGLQAADGVTTYLEARGLGTPIAGGKVMPVVPTSVIFDLGRFGRPWTTHATDEYGARAIAAAKAGPLPQGNVGGGAGAQTGGLKGGIGMASEDLGNGQMVGAVVNTNAFGSAVDDGNGCVLLGARYQIGTEFGRLMPPEGGCNGYANSPIGKTSAGENTTIGILATNVPMSRALLSKMAQYGQDGLGAALRPSHTYFDGDTIWAVSTAKVGTTLPESPGGTPTTGGGIDVPSLPTTGGSVALAVMGLTLGGLGLAVGRLRRRSAPIG